MKKELEILKIKFMENNYHLTPNDIFDLHKQLDRKPIQIYLLAFDFFLEHKESISYENVSNLIRVSIRIRDDIKKIITPLEEAVRVKYLKTKIDYYDIAGFRKNTYKKFAKIIDEIGGKEVNLYNEVRNLRNFVSHLGYPLISRDLKDIIQSLVLIKDIKFVDSQIINNYILGIYRTNDKFRLKSVSKIFKETKIYFD